MTGAVSVLIQALRRRRRGDFAAAAIAAALSAGAAVLLLSLSGAFLVGAGVAGATGAVAAFNYLAPSAAIRGLAITRTLGRYAERLMGHRGALHAGAALRPALFARIAQGPAATALGLGSGAAAGHVIDDVEALETGLAQTPGRAGVIAAALAAGAALAAVAPIGAAIFLAGALVTLAATGRRRNGEDQRLAAADALKRALSEHLDAHRELACFGALPDAVATLDGRGRALTDAALAHARRDARAVLVTGLITAGVVAAIAVAALDRPAAAVAAAVMAALAGFEALGSAPKIRAALDRMAKAAIRLDALTAPAPTPAAGAGAAPLSGRLTLAGIDLAPGSAIGLTGPSGAGKSAVLETLVGLRTPGSAGWAVGVEIAGLSADAIAAGAGRPLFAYAPQDAAMITGTIREALDPAGAGQDEAALWAALELAVLADRVRALPGGLDGWIGEGGEILSGGERRRLALARAYLRPAPWLLLDEPTEGLDAQTEARVMARLAERRRATGQGLILVSHRPAPLTLCERVIRL